MNKVLKNLQSIEVNTEKVKIIAVSKYVDTEQIIEAYKAGIRNFAESKIQDAEDKRKNLPQEIEKDIRWHFIGHIQSNKVKKITGNYEYIHSVDSLKIATLINEEAAKIGKKQKILIQVNIAEEETKFGFGVEKVKEVFAELIKLDSINVEGLMTIGPNTEDTGLIRATFRELKSLRDSIQEKYSCRIPELSMGMSNDYKLAIEEGSTMIRLGRILFK